MTESKKYHDYLEKNYNAIKQKIRASMFFQGFGSWDEDIFEECLTRIYEAVSKRGLIIDYSKIEQLIFIAYKNLVLKEGIMKSKLPLVYDYEFQEEMYENEDENEDDLFMKIDDDVEEHFKSLPDYIHIWRKVMSGERTVRGERQIYEDIKNYLKVKYRPEKEVNVLIRCNTKPVYQYDLDGKFIRKFSSLQEAVKVGYNRSLIRANLDNKIPYANGYVWSYQFLNKC